jgi:hypothetical protein
MHEFIDDLVSDPTLQSELKMQFPPAMPICLPIFPGF